MLLGTAVIVAYAVVSARSLGFFEWSIDEGMYLMRARMMGHGFRLYEDIWFNHPPLLVLLVQRVFLVFGESVELARWVAIGFALLGLMATLWLARLLDAWPGALVSALCLAAAPLFFSLSRAIMSSLPALCAGALALAAAMAARRAAYARARIALLIGAGLALGIGAAVKLIVLPLIVPLALIVLAPDGWLEESRSQPLPALRRRALHLLLVGGVASIPVVASFAAFGWQALWNQAVGSLFGARSAYSLDIVTNIQDVLEWASEGHLGLAALGIHGVARGAARNRAWRVMWVWLGASGLAVLLQAPLWSHHLVMLVFPLAVGAGPAAVWVAGDLARWIGAARAGLTRSVRVEPGAAGWSRAHDPGWRAFGALAMFAYLLVLPVVVKRDVRSTESTSDDPWLALELIQAEVPMGSYAVTDSPMLAFRAGLLVPPNLTDPGAKRFQSGELSLAEVADDVVAFRPSVVITWNGRFVTSGHRRLADWLIDNGWREIAAIDLGRERRVYLAPEAPVEIGEAENPIAFGQGLHLAGWDVSETAAAGGVLQVRLIWRSATPGPAQSEAKTTGSEASDSTSDYTAYVHLVPEPAGERVAQADGPPGRGVRPTDHWLPGERVLDVRALQLPGDLPPGEYWARVGLYDSESGDALRLESSPPGVPIVGDAVVIGPIVISAAGD